MQVASMQLEAAAGKNSKCLTLGSHSCRWPAWSWRQLIGPSSAEAWTASV